MTEKHWAESHTLATVCPACQGLCELHATAVRGGSLRLVDAGTSTSHAPHCPNLEAAPQYRGHGVGYRRKWFSDEPLEAEQIETAIEIAKRHGLSPT